MLALSFLHSFFSAKSYVRPKRYVWINLCFLLCLIASTLQAQVPSVKYKWLKVNNLSPIDSLTVFPESFKILIPADTSLHYSINISENKIRFFGKNLPDSVFVIYRTFGLNLGKTQTQTNNFRYQPNLTFRLPAKPSLSINSEKKEEWFSTRNLYKTGSLTRGISFGNTQNVFVNAGLNLQLEGKISDDVSIVAAISDQNVPYQPEGNTQTLQQFDRVFVQLSGKKTKLTVGDIVLKNPVWESLNLPSYFLRYYKNVQGGLIENSIKLPDNQQINTSIGGAVAKGRFASVFVDALEGVQGPYRLRGPNNERFIIVLANSERIFVDGKLLERGFNLDYVIDYNLAEITFSPKIVITKFTRIRVDFEFSERNYSRAIFTVAHQQHYKKLDFFVNYYSEKDNPRNPVTVSLSDNDRQVLNQIGNDIEKAVAPAVTELFNFDEKQILYRRTDSLADGQIFEVYQYSVNPADAKFQVSFSEVRLGNGNYVLKNTLANGRVYEWRIPINGVKQGNYEPIRLLPAPNKRQMITGGLVYHFSKNESFFSEVAYSDRDVNLFSRQGNEQNTATALKTGYRNTGKNIKFMRDYQYFSEVSYELNQQNFNPIDRFRDIEFDRDWSIRLDTVKAGHEQIFTGKVGVLHKPTYNFSDKTDTLQANVFSQKTDSLQIRKARFWQIERLSYEATKRIRNEELNGWQHRFLLAGNLGKLQIISNAFILFAEQRKELATWQRLRTEARYFTKTVVPGYVLELDKNKINLLGNRDSVIRTAMNFTSHTFFLQNSDSISAKFRADYTWRADNLPQNGRLLQNNLSQTINGSFQTKIAQNQDIAFIGTYRKLQNVLQKLPDEETIMGRLDWNGDFWQQNLRSQFTYNLATGRELKREFVFLPVPTGQGTHTWRDENGDGIQQLNEFYEAINSDERNFVKFFTPTDQYIRAYTQNLNYRLNANFPADWQNEKGLKVFLSKLSSVFSWTIFRKMTDENLYKRFVPFSEVADNQILSQQNLMRMVIFFNRTHSKSGLDLNVLNTVRKQLLTNGFETGRNREIRLNGRWNFQSFWNFRFSMAELLRANASDFLVNRNYQVQGFQVSPELSWQPNNDFRISGNYGFTFKQNILQKPVNEGTELASLNQFALEMRWNKLQKRSLSGTLKLIRIGFKNGIIDSPVGYEMLEALRPGTNWNWNLTWQQRLANGLQLNLIYEGRQSENQRLIQIGRVQVSALF